jgi:uncharacterized repeat protein (TIGR03803 family)
MTRISGIRREEKRSPYTLLATLLLFCAVTAVASAQTFTVLHTFTDGADGGGPVANPIVDDKGNVYGTTPGGGSYGVVYKLKPNGKETVLHAFTGPPDGADPFASLIRDAHGNLFGTTFAGGKFNLGTVFEITARGKGRVLHSFNGKKDGACPYSSLVQDSAGNLYGTAFVGGAHAAGTVFRLAPSGKFRVLYTFAGKRDGGNPYAGLIRDTMGNLYGTAENGGNLKVCGQDGCGVVFRIDASGKETVLHAFRGGVDGSRPMGGLVRDAKGNFYGTTVVGGVNGLGTIFKLSSTGKHAVLHSLTAEEGVEPSSSLVLDDAGNLYGTAADGGPLDQGMVFKLDPDGTYTLLLHDFDGIRDGYFFQAGVFRDTGGTLYGATQLGGKFGSGTVFKLVP